jgi:hypothetical protein
MEHDGARSGKELAILDLAAQARVYRLDRAASTVSGELARHGVRSLVLKGPGTAELLYPGEARSYCDVDLLVSPGDYEQATKLLESLGFRRSDPPKPGLVGKLDRTLEGEERSLYRASDQVFVDLHRSFHGLQTRQNLLDVLWPDRTTIHRSGVDLTVPGVPARMLIAILHGVGARHERIAKRVTGDVHRLYRHCDPKEWVRVRELADQLGVTSTVKSVLTYTSCDATSDILQRHFADIRKDSVLSHHFATGSLFSRWWWELRSHPVSGRVGWFLVPFLMGARPVKSAQQLRSKAGRGWIVSELKLLLTVPSSQ